MTEGHSAPPPARRAPPRRTLRKLQGAVVGWFKVQGREFPWRKTTDPFKILVAEVLLRQTQADRVVEPYLEITTAYPNVQSLASANIDRLRVLFRPLGLIRRADNLMGCAMALLTYHEGTIPDALGSLLSLPGVGLYAASAILCLGFGQPLPMVDEGSGRVLRRLFGLKHRGVAHADRGLVNLASSILPTDTAREFNLGLLDIAHAFCRPRSPRCDGCPLAGLCRSAKTIR
jgi:A/G-specific adenine glycosylase